MPVVSSHQYASLSMEIAPPASTNQSPRMVRSMSGLEADSHLVRVALNAKEQSDKSTSATYERHVRRYMTWWDGYQSSTVLSDTTKVQIPAFPVTAAKVTMFLEHESTRPKVGLAVLACGTTIILTSFVGDSENTGALRPSQGLWLERVSLLRPSRPSSTIDFRINTCIKVSLRLRSDFDLTLGSAALSLLQSITSQRGSSRHKCSRHQAARRVSLLAPRRVAIHY